MIENIFISLIYILPIGGVSYTLFKYSIRHFGLWKDKTSNVGIAKSAKLKMIASFLGGLAAATLGFLWLGLVWIPSIKLPPIVMVVFLILMVPFICLLAALGGLGKAVGAGAGSASNILKDLKKDILSEEAKGTESKKS